MKNIMILSGGTSTAWHIAFVLKKYFKNSMRLIVCDINPSYLVHTSVLADKFIQTPLIKSPEYYATMLGHLEREHVHVLVPLIDDDILLFPNDNSDLRSLGVMSTAPSSDSINALTNKGNLNKTLAQMGVIAPRTFDLPSDLEISKQYFVKNVVGCGSKDAELVSGEKAMHFIPQKGKIVQEVCHEPEITVDVVRNKNDIYTLCRERLETKLGVSTKCKVYFDADIQTIIEQIAHQIDLPIIFCVQFMKNSDEKWTLIDFNLRAGGGTAISAAVGFQALRFACASWLGLRARREWLCTPQRTRYVVRCYQEIVTG